eukprot:Em0003g94a
MASSQAFDRLLIQHREIMIDKSIIVFKGRLSWIQYLPKKPHKWGLKAKHWRLYTRKEPQTDGMECVYRTILCYRCPVPLKGKGYDFYPSPQLNVGRMLWCVWHSLFKQVRAFNLFQNCKVEERRGVQ